MRTLRSAPACSAALAAAVILAAGPSRSSPVPAEPTAHGRVRLAASALGDLSSFRTIADDMLALVKRGDIPAARARAKDLETARDKADASLKPKDQAAWTAVDGKNDGVLADVRTPDPKPAACEASLGALLARLDAAGRA